MERFTQMKKNSLLALKNHWGRAVCVLFLYFAVLIFLFIAENLAAYLLNVSGFRNLLTDPNLLVETVDLSLTAFLFNIVVTVVHILVVLPLTLGCMRWFFALISDRECGIGHIWHYFTGFKRYFKSLLLTLGVTVRSLLWLVLFSLPGIVVMTLSTFLFGAISDQPQLLAGVFGILLGCILLLIGFIFWIVYNSRYFLAPYFFFDNEEIGIHEAVRLSVRNMKGRKLAWAKYLLSFIGWIALCLVLLPVFFVLPYMGCAFSIYGKLMVESHKHKHAAEKQAVENDRTMEYLTQELRPFTQPPAGAPSTLQNPQGLGQNG